MLTWKTLLEKLDEDNNSRNWLTRKLENMNESTIKEMESAAVSENNFSSEPVTNGVKIQWI